MQKPLTTKKMATPACPNVNGSKQRNETGIEAKPVSQPFQGRNCQVNTAPVVWKNNTAKIATPRTPSKSSMCLTGFFTESCISNYNTLKMESSKSSALVQLS
jgi:hypothetical protein